MKLSLSLIFHSVSLTLYPTTFRWNFRSIISSKYAYSSFISHYVQMKLPSTSLKTRCWKSLYPTTFRWNPAFPDQLQKRVQLYIPLRSDETTWADYRCTKAAYLYIPLRSDETLIPDSPRTRKSALYPTTFRWNGDAKAIPWHQPTLYPTTFRWNPYTWDTATRGDTALYPTTFRWNFPNVRF